MKVLFSITGSNGNCSVIESSSGDMICIDAGLPYQKANKEIGYYLHKCRTLLCSHHHSDHTSNMSDFRKRGMVTYCGEETALKTHLNGFYEKLKQSSQFEGGSFRWISFELPHTNSDGSKCECFGFLIQDIKTKERLLWCTDCQYIPYQFPAIEIYCIETNYFEQDSYIDDLDVIEKSVEYRRFNSHMSIQSTVDFLKKQDLSKCKEIRLIHLSNSMTKEEKGNIIPYIKEQLGRDDINVII